MGGGGGTDLALSFSGSSSATSGIRSDKKFSYGDVIIKGSKGMPPWVWLALGGMALIGITVWLVRR
jgi:hypothetical protein